MARWGVMEQPERDERAARAGRIAADLAERGGVSGVAVTWVDNSGITRVKAVPLGKLERAAAWGIGVSGCFDTFLLDDSAAVARGEVPIEPFAIGTDIEATLRARGMASAPLAPAEEEDDDE